MYDQRDVVLIPFPYSDLTAAKQRPALIISNKNINSKRDRICALVTSKPSKDGDLITADDFSVGMLPFKSWVRSHRLFTIHEKIIRKKLCKVTGGCHSRVIDHLNQNIRSEE